ncbi:hypothetical protein CLAIMM_04895 [Cladophialophora immunda]|nr:hypothetical protein CLAIMM_04895 [Cladophialophora immunda]
MESRQPREYTRLDLEAAQTLATFRLTAVETVRDVEVVFYPAESQVPPPANAPAPDPAAANPAMGKSRQLQPVAGPPIVPSAPLAHGNSTSALSNVHQVTATPRAAPDSQAKARHRYSCYMCHHVSQKVGCVVNHMAKQHGLERVLVDRARIEASGVQMLW